MNLGLDDDELSSCVQCGLCLPHCPTFRVTGEESASPRGRISLMREVQQHGAAVDEAFVGYMDACVQCRACEPACPAGVPFGRLMERTRETLAETRPSYVPRWRRLGYRMLAHHRLVVGGSRVLAVAQRLHVWPRSLSRRLSLPERVPLRQPRLRASGSDVWLFTGCVMDAWERHVHTSAARVIESMGVGVAYPSARGSAGCCGALAVHAGLKGDARRMAVAVMASMPGAAPILVDSAGCGAALKDYGHLVGTDASHEFSRRVVDLHEWLAPRVGQLRVGLPVDARVAVHDPCHLRNVQRGHEHVRTVLRPFVRELVELDDEGLCCGAGGAYAALHPEMASEIRARKLESIARSGAEIVVSANPGCTLHLAAAGIDVVHPVQLIEKALHG
ncbi:MAG: glycolate oxidase iron-sulfur subunit [Acidimicrobiaceae bacterium]|jgi:glycolate oxidase iron-sulfur subunit